MQATLRLSTRPSVATLVIEGELDIVERRRLAWRLLDLDSCACETIHLDVSRVHHVDVDSLRLINEARRRAIARGVSFDVVAASLCFGLISRTAGFAELAERSPQMPDVVPAG